MIIDTRPETEQFVRAEVHNDHFQWFDDLIISGVLAWDEVPPQPLLEFYRQSPLFRLELNLERDRDRQKLTRQSQRPADKHGAIPIF